MSAPSPNPAVSTTAYPQRVHESARWPPGIVAWGWLLILFLAYSSSFIDRQILSLMVEPIKRDLGITDTQFGLLHGLSFALFYTTLGIPIGTLVDAKPRRTIIFLGISAWSFMTALCGAATQFVHLFLTRIGVGVGEAALSPAAYSLLSDCFPPKRLGLALSVYFMGVACGAGLALIFGGWVISLISGSGPVVLPVIGELASWQAVFIVVSLPGIPIAALVLCFKEPARQNVNLAVKHSWRDIGAFLRRRSAFFATLCIGVTCFATAATATLSWSPAYFMRVHGFTATEVGYAFGGTTLVAMISGMLFGAWFASLLTRRGQADGPVRAALILVATSIPMGMLALIAPGAPSSLAFFGAVLFFNSAPAGVCAGFLQSLTPNQMRGRVSAIYLFATNVLSIVAGPLIPALISDHMYRDPSRIGDAIAMTTTSLGVIGAVAFYFALRRFASLSACPEGIAR